jgi:hypothetical protein
LESFFEIGRLVVLFPGMEMLVPTGGLQNGLNGFRRELKCMLMIAGI